MIVKAEPGLMYLSGRMWPWLGCCDVIFLLYELELGVCVRTLNNETDRCLNDVFV